MTKSKTEVHYLSGTAYWAKVHTPDPKYNRYTVDLALTDDSLKKFKELGLGLKLRKNEETGESIIRLARPVSKIIKGDLVTFPGPKIVDKNNAEITDLIGNGSKVVCKIVVYPTVKGPGHRLDAMMVTDLVKFAGSISPADFENQEEVQDGDIHFKPF